jgi:hypothetical protein
MALTDRNEPLLRPGHANPGHSRLSQPSSRTLPLAALARLPEIHAETSDAARLNRFLRASVGAAAGLMLLGALAVSVMGDTSLKQEFAWSLLVLFGVAAMLRSYIKSTAQAFDRAPLNESARDLRAVLFYTGFAWGAGAFLVLGDNPLPLMGLGFAVLPSLVLLPLLKDRAAAVAFVAPVTALTAAAILLEHWGGTLPALALLLFVQGSILAGLRVWPARERERLPDGLSLL